MSADRTAAQGEQTVEEPLPAPDFEKAFKILCSGRVTFSQLGLKTVVDKNMEELRFVNALDVVCKLPPRNGKRSEKFNYGLACDRHDDIARLVVHFDEMRDGYEKGEVNVVRR